MQRVCYKYNTGKKLTENEAIIEKEINSYFRDYRIPILLTDDDRLYFTELREAIENRVKHYNSQGWDTVSLVQNLAKIKEILEQSPDSVIRYHALMITPYLNNFDDKGTVFFSSVFRQIDYYEMLLRDFLGQRSVGSNLNTNNLAYQKSLESLDKDKKSSFTWERAEKEREWFYKEYTSEIIVDGQIKTVTKKIRTRESMIDYILRIEELNRFYQLIVESNQRLAGELQRSLEGYHKKIANGSYIPEGYNMQFYVPTLIWKSRQIREEYLRRFDKVS